MSKKTEPPQKEPLEWVKNLIATSWSNLVVKLMVAIITGFCAGFGLGFYIANLISQKNLLVLEMKHQRELYNERKAGKEEAIADVKRQMEQAEYIFKIYKEGK